MSDLDMLPIAAATGLAFALSGGYYAIVSPHLAGPGADQRTDADRMPPWVVAVEFARNLLVAVVVAGLAVEAGIDQWWSGVVLGAALWIAFPVVLWIGAVVHERTPPRIAAVHAGDWLLKLVAVSTLTVMWQ